MKEPVETWEEFVILLERRLKKCNLPEKILIEELISSGKSEGKERFENLDLSERKDLTISITGNFSERMASSVRWDKSDEEKLRKSCLFRREISLHRIWWLSWFCGRISQKPFDGPGGPFMLS